MCYRTGKIHSLRDVRASFSPEMLQAGAVKGLMVNRSEDASCRKKKTDNMLIIISVCLLNSLAYSMNIYTEEVCFFGSCRSHVAW